MLCGQIWCRAFNNSPEIWFSNSFRDCTWGRVHKEEGQERKVDQKAMNIKANIDEPGFNVSIKDRRWKSILNTMREEWVWRIFKWCRKMLGSCVNHLLCYHSFYVSSLRTKPFDSSRMSHFQPFGFSGERSLSLHGTESHRWMKRNRFVKWKMPEDWLVIFARKHEFSSNWITNGSFCLCSGMTFSRLSEKLNWVDAKKWKETFQRKNFRKETGKEQFSTIFVLFEKSSLTRLLRSFKRFQQDETTTSTN